MTIGQSSHIMIQAVSRPPTKAFNFERLII